MNDLTVTYKRMTCFFLELEIHNMNKYCNNSIEKYQGVPMTGSFGYFLCVNANGLVGIVGRRRVGVVAKENQIALLESSACAQF
jgi:hypothetical protein